MFSITVQIELNSSSRLRVCQNQMFGKETTNWIRKNCFIRTDYKEDKAKLVDFELNQIHITRLHQKTLVSHLELCQLQGNLNIGQTHDIIIHVQFLWSRPFLTVNCVLLMNKPLLIGTLFSSLKISGSVVNNPLRVINYHVCPYLGIKLQLNCKLIQINGSK